LTLLAQFEKEHRLARWNLDDEDHAETKRKGTEMWIDSLVDELRAATAGELYSQSYLYDHGHGNASVSTVKNFANPACSGPEGRDSSYQKDQYGQKNNH
jgi:hypothetical protein